MIQTVRERFSCRRCETIVALFAIEREISGLPPAERLAVRVARSKPLVGELETWMRDEREWLSKHVSVAKAMWTTC